MTEQQYHVIADRSTDDVYGVKREPFDRVTYGPLGHDIVRIERPVPTTDENGEQFTPSTAQVRSHYVFDQSNSWDPERGAAFDRWLTSVSTPHPPTREQVYRAALDAVFDLADHDAVVYPLNYRERTILDAVLALIQNGADR